MKFFNDRNVNKITLIYKNNLEKIQTIFSGTPLCKGIVHIFNQC